jgi:hypothetical protein
MLAVYVSGHGFGHATRTAEVLRALRVARPGVRITVCTSLPAFLFTEMVPGGVEMRALACDVGLAQRGALAIDEEGTVAAWRAFEAQQPARIAAEAAWLRECGAALVLGDVPPLAFEAAAAAGVPSVALANFSWDWVYRHYAGRHAALHAAALAAAASYAHAGLLLQLPFAGDMRAFPVREEIPLVARQPRLSRAEARRRLGLTDAQPIVLLSFGGLGLPGFDPAVLAATPRVRFLMQGPSDAFPPNVDSVAHARLAALGLAYPDVVAAADIVVTKPGYGIVSDCAAARTRIVYTDRGDFPEYPVLVRDMPAYVACAFATNEAIFAGELQDAIDDVLAQPWPGTRRLDGADVAARRIVERIAWPADAR